ncbi:hypothetical protein F383_01233 [Gossypium arboreum]|uniref:Uncharacterized protein n=1 Tax=Gossypium arboreum TaxID=29729 RepID=A0A0B0PMS7_GOSAR|nr:hypothetical protein F383_27316 [Gossypium arboreum]KHG24716.1 hypothetical protein F383_01233 [Gossypium arboreum]
MTCLCARPWYIDLKS